MIWRKCCFLNEITKSDDILKWRKLQPRAVHTNARGRSIFREALMKPAGHAVRPQMIGLVEAQRRKGEHGEIDPAAEAVLFPRQAEQREHTPGAQDKYAPG